MSPRSVYPRSAHSHEAAAAAVLERFALAERWRPCLPVPVERIVESIYGLSILWSNVEERPGEQILGFLSPIDRRIVLNERHATLFESVIGPERFTLAHELGHWIYDADNPDQGSLFDAADSEVTFCRGLGQSDADVREINANKFASRLLLPAALVRSELLAPFRTWHALAGRAADWGVSQQTVVLRLNELGLGGFLPH